MYDSSAESEFKTRMCDYIRAHFGDLLGEHIGLLDEEGGLDRLSEMMRRGEFGEPV